jgi:hypothetical protein
MMMAMAPMMDIGSMSEAPASATNQSRKMLESEYGDMVRVLWLSSFGQLDTDLNQVLSVQSDNSCPTPSVIDGLSASIWTDAMGPMIAGHGYTINTAADAKKFIAENCATAKGEGEMCVSKAMVPILQALFKAMDDPVCAGVINEEEFCRTNPVMINQTCAKTLGAATFGLDSTAISDLWTTGEVSCSKRFKCVHCQSVL